jgi:hypothetical protein
MKTQAGRCSTWRWSLLRGRTARFYGSRARLDETRAHGPVFLDRGSHKWLLSRRASDTFRGVGRPGRRVHEALRRQVCSVVRTRWETGSELETSSLEDSDFFAGDSEVVLLGRCVRSCRRLRGAWYAPSVRLCTRDGRAREGGCGGSPHLGQSASSRPRRSEEVKAGAPNQYGARLAGRALCSPGQRDERTRRRW